MMSKIVTHDSKFHTDDVFAVATLLLLLGDAEVVRTRDKEKIAEGDYVADVGMEHNPAAHRFDHHQPGGAGKRENGIQYASFGLVWKEYGAGLAGGEREAALLDRELVQPIDAHDNGMAIAEYKFKGVRDYTIGDFFSSFVEARDPDHLSEVFKKCVEIAKELLLREIRNAKKTVADQDKILNIYNSAEDKRLIIFSEELSGWRELLGGKPEPLYVVHPRPDGNWGINGVPDLSKSEFGILRKDLPAEWAGKTGAELAAVSGVPDALFVHRGLFMASVRSKEGAVALAQKALNA